MKKMLCAVLAALPLVLGTVGSAGAAGDAKIGGTLRVNLANDVDYVDPALAYLNTSWELEYATSAKLLNYPDRPAPEGSRLRPEVAVGFPRVSADGRTYTFTVRTGKAAYRFSNGETVTAASFARAIQRARDPRMQSPAASFLADVVSVRARGATLRVTLKQAAPDFLARIAMPFFAAVPRSTPVVPEGLDAVPSAGPYYVASRTPNRQIVLKRNPFYKGSRPQNLAQIVYTVGVSQDATKLQIEKGEADYAADGLAPAAWGELAQRYGVNKGRVFVKPMLVLRYLALNNARPLFRNNLRLRRAVNYAIDRPALVRQLGAFAGKRTDQYLPPGMDGFRDAALYPLRGADPKTAAKLAKGATRGGEAVLYTCNRSACTATAQIIQYNLQRIGIDVDVQQFATPVQFEKLATRGEPFDIGYHAWVADYADPFSFLNVLLDGDNIRDTHGTNVAYFDDPKFDAKLRAAARLQGPDRTAGYAKLDADLAWNGAPWAPWANANARLFVSERVRGVTFNPVYGLSLTSLALS